MVVMRPTKMAMASAAVVAVVMAAAVGAVAAERAEGPAADVCSRTTVGVAAARQCDLQYLGAAQR